jgi:hypothetical protein
VPILRIFAHGKPSLRLSACSSGSPAVFSFPLGEVVLHLARRRHLAQRALGVGARDHDPAAAVDALLQQHAVGGIAALARGEDLLEAGLAAADEGLPLGLHPLKRIGLGRVVVDQRARIHVLAAADEGLRGRGLADGLRRAGEHDDARPVLRRERLVDQHVPRMVAPVVGAGLRALVAEDDVLLGPRGVVDRRRRLPGRGHGLVREANGVRQRLPDVERHVTPPPAGRPAPRRRGASAPGGRGRR